jgi:stage V sporulation protein G
MAKKKIVGTVTVNDIDRPYEMVVTAVQVFPFKDTAASLGHIKGLAQVVLNDALTIRGLRVMEGENGLFVGYPLDPFYKGDDFRSIVFPMTRELREHIENVVLEKYQAVNV